MTKVTVKETILIDDADNLLEILSANLRIKNKDTKISYNKLLSKADLDVEILYLTEDRKNKKCRRDNTSDGIY